MKELTSGLLPATTHSAEETEALGRALASSLEAGDVLALHGDLGAGKTHLVRGLCAGLGLDVRRVTSPTFTLVHEYAGPLAVYHFDAYRLEGPGELLELGFDEYVADEGVCLIEWPERVGALLPADTYHLYLEHRGGDVRCVRWGAPPDSR